MSHFKEECEFGFIHGQCRCPAELGNAKESRLVTCDRRLSHAPIKDLTEAEFLYKVTHELLRETDTYVIRRLTQLQAKIQRWEAEDKAMEKMVDPPPEPEVKWMSIEGRNLMYFHEGNTVTIECPDKSVEVWKILEVDRANQSMKMERVRDSAL